MHSIDCTIDLNVFNAIGTRNGTSYGELYNGVVSGAGRRRGKLAVWRNSAGTGTGIVGDYRVGLAAERAIESKSQLLDQTYWLNELELSTRMRTSQLRVAQ